MPLRRCRRRLPTDWRPPTAPRLNQGRRQPPSRCRSASADWTIETPREAAPPLPSLIDAPRRLPAGEHMMTDLGVFPIDGIVQRNRPHVAPEAVEAVAARDRPR